MAKTRRTEKTVEIHVAQVPARLIYRWVEAGAVHYQEAADGSLTVCLKSLPAAGGLAGEV